MSSYEPERRDRRAERHASTKREIIDAAWQLSGERGLAGWSLRDVADIVAMRAPSLYVYFESKNALYDAMFADGYQAMLDRIEQTPVVADPVTMLHRAAHVFFDFAVEQPARYFLLFLRTIPGFEPSPASYRLALESLDSLRDVLASAGVVDDAAVDLFTALISGLATQQVSNDPTGDRWANLLDGAIDMYWHSVETAPSTRQTRAPSSRSDSDAASRRRRPASSPQAAPRRPRPNRRS